MPAIGGKPSAGINGTSSSAHVIVATLYMAGDSAGMKNRCSEFSIPMHAAATATNVRKGSISLVRKTVSSSFPGTARYAPANNSTSGSANTIPITTRIPVMTMRPLMTLFARRHADALPDCERCRVKVGTKALLIAPSANRSRTRFGMRYATLYASIALPAPKSAASTCSRTTPRIRLVIVAAPADAADRASVEVEEDGGLGAKLAADRFVDRLAVGVLARQLRHHRLHDFSHVLGGCGAGFGNCRRNGRLDVLGARRRRQVFLEDTNLRGFLVHQIGTARLRELIDRIAPLFHQGAQDLQHFRILEAAALLDFLVH